MGAASGTPGAVLRVGEWVVYDDLLRIESRDGHAILEPRPMQLLLYLAERADRVIPADQLLTDIWGGTFYGDSPLQRAMAGLRRALGDSATAPTYIQTIRKRGYRLIAPVSRPGVTVPGAVSCRWSGQRPYRGLLPFTTRDAAVYFGRTRTLAATCRALLTQVTARSNLALVLGPSGAGKTSLVQAGLIPALTQSGGVDGLQAGAVAFFDAADVGEEGLAGGLALAIRAADEGGRFRLDAIADAVSQPGGHADAIARAAQMSGLAPDLRLLLVVDHAEHLARRQDTSAIAHLTQALEGLSLSSTTLTVVVARSDLYPELLRVLPSLADWKSPAGHVDVQPPTTAELAEIIRAPALAAGLRFEHDATTGVSLDEQLIEDCAGQTHALPLLQFVLAQLYEQRRTDGVLTFAAYSAIGGIAGAIAGRAEGALADLPAQQRDTGLDGMLAAMTTVSSDGQLHGARAVAWAELTNALTREVTTRLIDARLIIADHDGAVPVLRVAHEALLSAWPKAQQWIERNRQRLLALDRLRVASRRWHAEGEPDDLLLASGRQLTEAEDLSRGSPALARDAELRFIAASRSRRRTQLRRRNAIGAALAASLVGAAVVGVIARTSDSEAKSLRGSADRLARILVNDLPDKLRPLGRLDLLDRASSAVLAEQGGADCGGDPAASLLRATALRNQAEVLHSRRKLGDAEQRLTSAAGCLPPDAEHSDDPDVLVESGTIAFWRGTVALEQKNLARARAMYQSYERAARRLIAIDPHAPKWALELSYALNNLGSVDLRGGLLSEAERDFRQSIALKREVLAANPLDAALAADLADSYSWLATVLDRRGDLQGALQMTELQLELLEPLVNSDPTATLWVYRRGLANKSAGRIAAALSDPRTQTFDDRAVRDLTDASASDPANTLWKHGSISAAVFRARHAVQRGDLETGAQHIADATEQIDSVAENEWTPDIDRASAELSLTEAIALTGRERHADAITEAQTACALLDVLVAQQPDDRDIAGAWLDGQYILGLVAFRAGQRDHARETWVRASSFWVEPAHYETDRRIESPLRQINAALAMLENQGADHVASNEVTDHAK
jgi:DNA-binding winged helix-turn-helix (wHTH) protein/tetratricopeptide (TPR) repeat protein